MNVYFARDGKMLGCYPDDGVMQLLDGHAIMTSDYFWHEGMADWQSVASKWEMPPPARSKGVPQTAERVRP
ncbi:MAG: DUF4339 domain-containing protein [Verrucomicrobia bacterium]|nr:DUF4339 domain-containing protein [Verrucomicrobiota bacterium]